MGINVVMFEGLLGKDAEARHFNNSDKGVVNFTVAVRERWNDANGQPVEKTSWIDCAWYVSARALAWAKENLLKGQLGVFQGKLVEEKWETETGTARKLVVHIEKVKLDSNRKSQSAPSAGSSQSQQQPAQQRHQSQPSHARQEAPQQQQQSGRSYAPRQQQAPAPANSYAEAFHDDDMPAF